MHRQYPGRAAVLHLMMLSLVSFSLFIYRDATITPMVDMVIGTASSYHFSHDSERYRSLLQEPVSGLPLNSTPSEAFVTFCNNEPKYLSLLTLVLDSVHQFSTRPIIVYGIDVDINLNTTRYPRLIKRRLSQKDCGPSVYFCKIYAILNSQIDYGIYIEADTLVNWNVDLLFDVLHRWPYPLPIAPRHPQDPKNYHRFLRQFHLSPQNRTTPYIHAHILWNYRAYPFLRQVVDLLRQGYFMDANYDETAMNILLWHARANHTLCKIDPYYAYLPAYELQTKKCQEFCHTAFILIHGSKNPIEMNDLLHRLKAHGGRPFIQTIENGFHHLNETQYTCCYPDSQRSVIHPLLCEHRSSTVQI